MPIIGRIIGRIIRAIIVAANFRHKKPAFLRGEMLVEISSTFFNSDIYTVAKCDIIRLVFWVHRANARSPESRSLNA